MNNEFRATDSECVSPTGRPLHAAGAPARAAVRPPHFLFAIWMVGGIQTVFNNMRTALESRDDARFSWLPIDMYPDDWITRIPPISLNGSWKNSMATWWRMRPHVRERGDVDAAYVLEHTLLMFLRGFRRRVPFLLATDITPLFCARHKLWYAVPEFDPASRSSRIKQRITRSVYASAYHLLPWSTAVRDSFVEDYGIPADRMTVLPPGIDIKTWQAPDRAAGAEKASERPFRILHVGWDFTRKGGDLLAQLAHEPEFHDCEFHFVTSSFAGERRPNIIIHTDLEPNSAQLRTLYRDADAFVLPTRADTYSMVALEAMAMGLPVVISSVGGIPDIVAEGETGYLIPPGDQTRLRERIRALRANRPLRLSMGLRGRTRVERQFNLNDHVSTVMDLLFAAAHSRARKDSR